METEVNQLPGIKKLGKKKNSGDINFIVDRMRKRFAFSNLNQEQLEACAELFEYGEVGQTEILFHKGMTCNNFFIIEQGQITITFDNGERNTLRTGDGFGEMTLIYDLKT